MAGHEEAEMDSNGEDAQLQRIEAIKKELNRINGGPVELGFSEDCPPAVQERFLKRVLAYETRPPVVIFDELLKAGVRLPPPEQLDDSELARSLGDMLCGMVLLGIYIEHTDHLGDRELYSLLWMEGLRERIVLMPEDPGYITRLDMVGSGSDEDLEAYFRFYADKRARRDWVRRFPGWKLPPHQDPPHDRDRHLPKPPQKSSAKG